MFKRKIPTGSQLKRLKELEEIKQDYLKQFKNPIVKAIMNVLRWYKVEGLVFLLILAVTAIVVLTVSYNKRDGLEIKRVETNINIEKKL